jgi:hypothetical protein
MTDDPAAEGKRTVQPETEQNSPVSISRRYFEPKVEVPFNLIREGNPMKRCLIIRNDFEKASGARSTW